MGSKLKDIVAYLNTILAVDQIQDFPNAFNGLQVENNGLVHHIVGAVDASLESIDKAIACGADLLIVHHGLLWSGTHPMIGSWYQLYKKCFDNNLAIYSAHLPLDLHASLGHNAIICQKLGASGKASFAEYAGRYIGYTMPWSASRKALCEALSQLFPLGYRSLNFGPENPRNVGVLSGSGGASVIQEAQRAGIDTLITGEIRYSCVAAAQMANMNVYACGHYATECFGVRVLLESLAQYTNIPTSFIDCPSDL